MDCKDGLLELVPANPLVASTLPIAHLFFPIFSPTELAQFLRVTNTCPDFLP